MNNLNKLTLQLDDPNSSAIQPVVKTDYDEKSAAFCFQSLFHLLTLGLILAAFAIPYFILENYNSLAPKSTLAAEPITESSSSALDQSDSSPKLQAEKKTEQKTASRTPVDSSDIVSIGHDPQAKTLVIEFTGGRIYQYSDVPAEVHKNLMKAESHGAFFHREIKDAGYEFELVK